MSNKDCDIPNDAPEIIIANDIIAQLFSVFIRLASHSQTLVSCTNEIIIWLLLAFGLN